MAYDRFDIQNKVALITGAGAGLGRGYARIFAQAGCRVVCADINEAAAADTAAEILAAGGQALPLFVDVTKIKSVEELCDRIEEAWGPVEILVNNAGVEDVAPFLEVTEAQYDKIHGVNLRGVFFTGQTVAKRMRDNGGGKIINIGSLGSYIGLTESSVYCSTKGGVIQLSKTMALELAPYNIQVNCVAPGYFITPMTQGFYDDPQHRSWIESRIPLGRWGTVDDLGGTLLFLASPASDYITGDTIIVDGGWLAG